MISPETRADRVLVVGFDGGTFDVLLPLAESGVMPNFAALLRDAARGTLRSTLPCITPVAWTTFLTGADPQTHGIWDYRYFDAVCRRTLLTHAGRIGIPTLFDVLSQQGGEAVSIDLPMTWPAPPQWRGLVLGGLGTPSTNAAFQAHPEFHQRVAAQGIAYSLDPIWRRPPQTWEELRRQVSRTEAAFRSRVAVAELADHCRDWQLMIVQFQHLDGLQHRAWHLLGPPIADGAKPAWCAQVHRAYRALDECLGRLLVMAEKRRAAVLVISDHGFGPFQGQIVMPELLARSSLLVRPSSWRRAQQAGVRAAWRLRKFLHRRLTGRSTAHLPRPVSAALNVDWQRTAALTLHGNLAALVYLNTPERFGTRALCTPRLRDQARQDVLGALTALSHPLTGQKLFVEILEPQASNAPEVLRSQLPDVVAIPAPGYHTRHKLGPRGSLIQQEPMLAGTHRQEGILVCKAPGVTKGSLHLADLRDVAPTILKLLGLHPAATMRGRALVSATPTRHSPETESLQAHHSPSNRPQLAGGTQASSPESRDAIASAAPLNAPSGPFAKSVSLSHGMHAAALSEYEEALVLGRLRDLGYVE